MPTAQVPSRSLPAKASQEYLRKEAKRFAWQKGLNLVAAQRALAHEYGHRNWAELMAAVRTILRPAQVHDRSEAHRVEPSGALELRDQEWRALRNLAQASLKEMKLAPNFKEWLDTRNQQWIDNRKSFLEAGGLQQQFVATSGDQIVGYAAAEHPPAWMRNKPYSEGEYRLFVIVEPAARKTLGTRLLGVLGKYLVDRGARRAWVQEYEADKGLAAFLEQKGFVKRIAFTAENGDRIVRHSMDAPFDRLLPPAHAANESQTSAHDQQGR